MRRLAVLSMHTSPLAQPGHGDGGGMNVYVRQLATALARSGVECDVFTRAWSADLGATVRVEPGLRVHHVPAGPLAPLPKEDLPALLGEFTDGVLGLLTAGKGPFTGEGADAIHANYWLSGMAGHVIKHELNIPMVSTFHTLARVKAEAVPGEVAGVDPTGRAAAEAEVIGCSDAVLASCPVEADQVVRLYGADPARLRIVPPGVDHAFFGPGNGPQARRAIGLPPEGPLLLFVGRIQPLKGADIAICALGCLDELPDAHLVVVGGPSGSLGEAESWRLRRMAAETGVGDRVVFVPPQPHELLSTYYRAADVCLVPSRSESFGLVALEAAACGVPVVASSVGGLATLVQDGRTGLLVDSRDPLAFAVGASRILSDPQLKGEMRAAAVARSRSYTWAEAARRLAAVYDELEDRRLVECL